MEVRRIRLYIERTISDLSPGEELFIPCVDKLHRSQILKAVRNELKDLEQLQPDTANLVLPSAVFRDKQFWISLKRLPENPSIIYKKSSDGSVKELVILSDAEFRFRLQAMITDGLKESEIRELHETLALSKSQRETLESFLKRS